jgi:hypothetical protein
MLFHVIFLYEQDHRGYVVICHQWKFDGSRPREKKMEEKKRGSELVTIGFVFMQVPKKHLHFYLFIHQNWSWT